MTSGPLRYKISNPLLETVHYSVTIQNLLRIIPPIILEAIFFNLSALFLIIVNRASWYSEDIQQCLLL